MSERNITPLRWLAQGLAYVLFAAAIGTFAAAPAYRPLPNDSAVIRLSFSHASARKVECRRLSPEEIAALAPNMRNALDCPRERVPVYVALALDGNPLYAAWLDPTGLSNDGASTAYQSFVVSSGPHQISAQLRDSTRAEGFDYESAIDVNLAPAEILVVDFDAGAGGFEFR